MERLERKAALTGIGQSEVGRRLDRDPLALTVDACLAAIEDAGLTREDIDGLATYPGTMLGAVHLYREIVDDEWQQPQQGDSPEGGLGAP